MIHPLEELLRCPGCGNVARLEDYDVLGADGDNVFCNQCHQEFDPSEQVQGELFGE